jgi:hypothetical protein
MWCFYSSKKALDPTLEQGAGDSNKHTLPTIGFQNFFVSIAFKNCGWILILALQVIKTAYQSGTYRV